MASDRRALRRSLVRRAIVVLVIAGVLVFAVQGGEFGTVDLVRQRRETTRLVAEIDSLRHLDSALTVYERNVEHDPATQERIAREVFGMVRGNKELLYRFTGPAGKAADTVRRTR